MLSKIERLKKMILANGNNTKIEIDGGVTLENASEILKAGADILVAGNTVFGAKDPIKTIELLSKMS